ncbi:MAG: hypothetical protein ACRC31_00965, partial [Cetobacterium sp.]
MNKSALKEKITLELSRSEMEREEGRFLTFKTLVKEFPNIDTDLLLEVLNELYSDGFVHFSKGMREKNSGYVYFVKNYKKPLLEKKTELNIDKSKLSVLNIIFMLVLSLGVVTSTKYSMDAMLLVGMDVREISIIIAFLISSLSIICHSIIRTVKGIDKILIGTGLLVLIAINLFCTTTVIINDYESDRVAIDPNTMKYQMLHEEKKIVLDSISTTHQQMLVQQELAKKLANETNTIGNDSKFYERQARQLSAKVDGMNIELSEINDKITEIALKDINIEKKKNSYDIIAS